ncbi:MAG: methyltransferase domain-containing protein [Candidatus Riflebacteria bacterium]|nr:methyltransferase domain-containing protein [Candidatus Riflebacteria bacterium]
MNHFCPLCQNLREVQLWRNYRHLVQCRVCKLKFVPTKKQENHEFYRQPENSPFTYYSQNKAASEKNADELFGIYEKLLRRNSEDEVFEPIVKGSKILDVGCSAGAFLQKARANGAVGTGIEINADCVNFCVNDLNLNVKKQSVEEAEFESHSFDLVNLGDVIEHLVQPLHALKKIFGWLKPGGFLTICTPDLRSIGTRIFQIKPDEHLLYFTEKTLSKLLKKSDFEVIFCSNFDPWRDLDSLKYSTTFRRYPFALKILDLATKTLGKDELLFRLPLRENLIMVGRK